MQFRGASFAQVHRVMQDAETLHRHPYTFVHDGERVDVSVEVFHDFYGTHNYRFRTRRNDGLFVTLSAHEFGRAEKALSAIGSAMCRLFDRFAPEPAADELNRAETMPDFPRKVVRRKSEAESGE